MLSEHTIKQQIEAMQEPYIYISTALERKGKSMHELYKAKRTQRITVPKESLVLLSKDETLKMVESMIQEHHAKTQGDLKILGKVRFYYYRHCDGSIYGFNKYGERL